MSPHKDPEVNREYKRLWYHKNKGRVVSFPRSPRKLLGRTITSHGYVLWAKRNKRYYEHRLVWELYNGPIPSGYVIHHKNSDKTDNKIENLEMLSNSEHTRRHGGGNLRWQVKDR